MKMSKFGLDSIYAGDLGMSKIYESDCYTVFYDGSKVICYRWDDYMKWIQVSYSELPDYIRDKVLKEKI